MSLSHYEELLKELGGILGSNLAPDKNQSCLLHFPAQGINIQIDLDHDGEKLLIGTQVGIVPPGPYREKVFKQALIDNGSAHFSRGILAYSEKNHSLVLFQYLFLAGLNGMKLNQFLEIFLQHAHAWVEAIFRGEIPQYQKEEVVDSKEHFFGLSK